MTVTEQTFNIAATRLFAIVIDPTTYPQWLIGTKAIREISPTWPKPGSYFKHTVGFGPIAIPDRTSVRSIEDPYMLELLVRARPAIEAVVRFDISDHSGGSKLRMQEAPVGVHKLIAPLVQPLIRARNERSLERLRSLAAQPLVPR